MVWAKQKDKIEGSMKAKVYTFIEKLRNDDRNPGLHIEPMQKPLDARVRTGRVDLNFRAVLFKIALGGVPTYFYYGSWPHDEAISIARASTLQVNDVNGVLEVIRGEITEREGLHTSKRAGAARRDFSTRQRNHRLANTSGPNVPATTKHPMPARATTSWENPLAENSFNQRLVSELGLNELLVRRSAAAASEDELLEALNDAPEWQANALLELAAGASILEVKSKLTLEEYTDDPGISDEEKIERALLHPASQMQFTFIGDDTEELKSVIEASDFDAWRTFLHPEQRSYAEKRIGGSFRLSGGAGTGKTVVLLHRSRMLAKARPESRIILTTFTTTLAQSLDNNLSRLDGSIPRANDPGLPGVFVSGIDSLVSKIVHAASENQQLEAMRRLFGIEELIPGKILDSQSSNFQWEAAARESDHGLPPEIANASFFQREYEDVILPNLITTREAYLMVSRGGRGTALNRSKRLGVWKAVEYYRRFRQSNMGCSFAELAHLAAIVLRQRSEEGFSAVADHVLVDESQDLHAGHWLFLRELVHAAPDDIFIAEDSHQRIYGPKVALSRFGISIVGRSRRLTLNYRTTQQNLGYALGLLNGVPITDLEGNPIQKRPYTSARSGPHPEEKCAKNFEGELDIIAESLKRWRNFGVALETVGILARSNFQVAKICQGLDDRGLKTRKVSAPAGKDIPVVMTMHRSKGMEFTYVVITGASEGALPAKRQLDDLAPAEREDVIMRERSLLYVASTRARDGLLVTWEGKPSVLLGRT